MLASRVLAAYTQALCYLRWSMAMPPTSKTSRDTALALDPAHLPSERVLAAVVHGFRPVWEVADEGQMPGLHMLYNRCVDGDPGARPTARELVAQLGQLEEEVRNEAQQERKLLKRQGKQEGR
ncbi:hypothetical protein QJQ45_022176 [Haematococcus lacustris]|nr:hypothetical protein QJQ45_022176 [Haematococcus lacustris]